MKKILVAIALISMTLGGAAFAAQACCPHNACCNPVHDCCK